MAHRFFNTLRTTFGLDVKLRALVLTFSRIAFRETNPYFVFLDIYQLVCLGLTTRRANFASQFTHGLLQ